MYTPTHTRGTVTGVQRLGHTANRGVATVSRYLGRTSVARAAAATFAEVGGVMWTWTTRLILCIP